MQSSSSVTEIYNLLNSTNCNLLKLPLTKTYQNIPKQTTKKLPTVTKSYQKIPMDIKNTKRYQVTKSKQNIPKVTNKSPKVIQITKKLKRVTYLLSYWHNQFTELLGGAKNMHNVIL